MLGAAWAGQLTGMMAMVTDSVGGSPQCCLTLCSDGWMGRDAGGGEALVLCKASQCLRYGVVLACGGASNHHPSEADVSLGSRKLLARDVTGHELGA